MKQTKTLHLNLTKHWFDKHLEDKPEEYREITPYWCSILLLHEGCHRTLKWWEQMFKDVGDSTVDFIQQLLEIEQAEFKDYTTAIYSNGMKPVAVLPRFTKPITEIVIDTGREEWGAEKDKDYFVIRNAAVTKRENC